MALRKGEPDTEKCFRFYSEMSNKVTSTINTSMQNISIMYPASSHDGINTYNYSVEKNETHKTIICR